MFCGENCQSSIGYVFAGGVLIIGARTATAWVPVAGANLGVGWIIAR